MLIKVVSRLSELGALLASVTLSQEISNLTRLTWEKLVEALPGQQRVSTGRTCHGRGKPRGLEQQAVAKIATEGFVSGLFLHVN